MAIADRLRAAGVKPSGSTSNYNTYSSKKKKNTASDSSALESRLKAAGVERQTTPAKSYNQNNRNNFYYQQRNTPSYTQNPLVQAAQNKVNANSDYKTQRNMLEQQIRQLQSQQQKLKPDVDAIRDINEVKMAGDTKTLQKFNTYNDIEKKIADLQAQNKELSRQNKMAEYSQVVKNADFAQNSQYKTTANGKEMKYAPNGNVTETGFDDYMYDYINKNQQAITAKGLNTSIGDVRLGTDDEYLQRMTDDQIATFNYLYSKDKNQAYEYIETIKPDLQKAQADYETQQWNDYAAAHPVTSSLLSVPNNLVGSVDALIGMGAAKLDGQEIDPNAGYFREKRATNAIRETVGQQVGDVFENTYTKINAKGMQAQQAYQAQQEGNLDTTLKDIYSQENYDRIFDEIKQSNFAQKVSKFGNTTYGSVMSQLDNMFNVALTGGTQGAALVLMSTTAMPDAISSAKERGATDAEAFSLGVIAGMAEYVTEKVSLEALFDMEMLAKQGLARYVGVNMLTEGSEEVASDIINFAAQEIISGNRSEFQQSIAEYESQGLSHEDAVKAAWADQIEQTMYSFLGGAIAGGGTAVSFGMSNQIATAQRNRQAENIKNNAPEYDPIRQMGNDQLIDYVSNVQQTRAADQISQANIDDAARLLQEKGDVPSVLVDAILSNENTKDMLEMQANESEELEGEESNIKTKEDLIDTLKKVELRKQNTMSQMAQQQEREYIDKIAADRFGNAGFEVYRSALRNNNIQDNDMKGRTDVLGDFTKAYNAGMNSQELPSGLRISETAAQAAYETGRNAVLDQYRDRNGKFKKGFTSYYGKEAGVAMDNDIVRRAIADGKITPEKMQGYADLAVALGTKLIPEEHMPQNGWYEKGGIGFSLDADNGLEHVLSHELTHRLQDSAPEEYERLKNFIADYIGAENLEKQLSEYYNLGKSQNVSLSNAQAMDEVVADWVANHMVKGDLEWTNFVNRNSQTQEGRSLLTKIRDFFQKILNKLKGSKSTDIAELTESLQKAQKLLDDTLSAAQKNVANKSTAAVSEAFKRTLESHGAYAGDNSVAKLSLRSWNATDINALKAALKGAGYSTKEINKWIKDVNGVAATVLADRTRLDYEADEYQSALKSNSDYFYTLDLSTLCKKRLLYQGTYNAIMHRLKNVALMPEDTINLRRMMDDLGYEVPCGICYEESRKKNEGKYAERWLNGYDKWAGYKNQKHEDSYIPKLSDVTTTDGRAWMRKNHPEALDSYLMYQRTRGNQNPKVSFTHTDYRGEILNMTAKDISDVKHIGGLRIQSFSDFETIHTIDMMQAVMDMAAKNLTAQAYTKVPAFADIFGGTGIKINLSLIGQVRNGKLVFDAKEGIDPKEAFRLRKKYSNNVGTILVGANDESIIAAMADPRVDMIIPFHRSGWSGAEYEKLGLKDYKDYTDGQTERYLMDGKDVSLADATKILGLTKGNELEGIYSEDYWDYSKTGKENAEAYLKLCAEKNYRPVFYQFLHDNGDGSWSLQEDGSTDGYWKMLTDYKMYDNDSVGAPQQEVKPNFDMRAANKYMREYDGNPNTLPVAEDVVDKFVKEFKSGKKLSLRQKDVGYHAGDLGKAESLFNQSGGRSTGHFGTGTYFVGNQARIEGYNSRNGKPAPTETADFSQYNLFKPKNYSDASALHEFMKDVDNGYGSYTGAKSTDEYNDLKEQLAEKAEEFGDNGFYEAYSNDAEIIDDVVRLADSTIGRRELAKVIASRSMVGDVSAYDGSLFDEQDNEITPDDYLKGLHHDDAENIIDWIVTEADNWRSDGLRMAGRYEDWHNTFGNVSRILGVSKDTLENIITEATEEAHQIDYPASTTADSIATRVMKRLGYEGVDVRHIDQMDNTTYGSVIYDLKGEDLARKQEIGTARFSLRTSPEFYSQLERTIEQYKGDKIGATSVESYLKGRGVKDEEIKWTGIRTFLEGKKSVSKEDLLQYIRDNSLKIEETTLHNGMNHLDEFTDELWELGVSVDDFLEPMDDTFSLWRFEDWLDDYLEEGEIDKKTYDKLHKYAKELDSNETKWSEYTIPGGTNYREILYKIPESEYTNAAMQTHWGDDGSGIVAHARIQDFGDVLFVEEIQSDWHNEGAKRGYRGDSIPTKAEIEKTAALKLEDNMYMLYVNGKSTGYGRTPAAFKKYGEKGLLDKMVDYYIDLEGIQEENLPEVAPFRNGKYVEFVLKNLLRKAAEEGKNYLAWTTGEMQEERWSNIYAEGYRIEYDQDIPRFLKKYGKQWGANLTTVPVGDKIASGFYTHDRNGDAVFWSDDEQDYFRNGEEHLGPYRAPAIEITDAMRESVLTEGQPMFSLRSDSQGKQLSPGQQEYFKDSKVVDENGNLLVMYHGTNSDAFTVFDPNRAAVNGRMLGNGFYFTDSEKSARKWGSKNVIKGYLNITNPFIVSESEMLPQELIDAIDNSPGSKKDFNVYKGMPYILENAKQNTAMFLTFATDVFAVGDPSEVLKQFGYDGIILKAEDNKDFYRIYGNQYVAFNENQIKKTTNKNPTDSPDIRHSLRGSQNIIESAERNASIRNGYMEAATNWRKNMTAFNDFGRSGFNTNMNALIRDYNSNLDEKTTEKIVGEIRQLTRDMVADKKMEYSDIVDRTNEIAAKILWGKEGTTDNLLFNESAAQAIDDIRNDIMAQILKTVTRGEGKYQRLSQEFADYRKKANESISEVRRKRDVRIDQMKQQRQAERERRSDSKERAQLLKTMKRLDSISKHASEANKALIQELIGDFNKVTRSITEGKADSLAEMARYIQDRMSVDPDFMPTERTLKDLARLSQKNIADLTIDEVRMLNEALLNIEHEIRYNKRLVDSNYKMEISALGSQIIDGVENTRGIGNSKYGVFNWFQQTLDKTVATPVIRPETEILRLVGFDRNNPLYQLTFGDDHSLASGQRDMVRYKWLANKRYVDQFVNDRAFANEIMGKKARACEITGRRTDGTTVTLKVTPDMLMALYMHAQNRHNFQHFGIWNNENGTQYGGGITIPDFELYRKGKIQEAYRVGTRNGNLITMTKSSLNEAFKQLTEKEMSFIRAAQEYYSEMSQPEINRVSNLLLGYEIAQEENYFRINTDSNYRGTNMDAIKYDGTIEGVGWTKERIEGARNPILLIPLTEQFSRDIDAHAKYIGLAIPVRNFNKAYGVNRNSYNEEGTFTGTTSSVQSAITGKWGSGATDYIQKLMSDIQNPRTTTEGWSKIFGKLRGYYAGSVLALNAGVAIKQAASYPTAAAEIGWAPLIKAFGNTRLQGKLDMDIVNRYSPLMYLRTQGMGYQELADLKKLNKGWLNRALNSKALNWINDMDVMTIKKLWKACEYYVRDNFKDLKVGSEEYYQKVGEMHSKVIERTQPNYTTLQRGEILRSDSDFVRMALGMFKTQPFQNFSVLFEATGELSAACRAYKVSPNPATNGMRKAAVKKMARALSSQLVASLIFAIMQGAWDWIRGRDDKYKDKEGNLSFGSAFKQIAINMGSNAFGMIPLGSVLYEVIETTVDTISKNNGGDAVFNATAYGLDASTATGIVNDLVDAIGTLAKNASSIDLDSKNTTEKHIRDYVGILATTAQAFGYPAENFVKDGQAIALNVFRTLGASGSMNKYEAEYYSKRIFSAVTSSTKKEYMDILYRAYDNDRDAYNKLYSLYTENDGFATAKKTSKEYIDSQMKDHIKKKGNEEIRNKVGLTESDLSNYQTMLDKYDTEPRGSYTRDEVLAALMAIDLSMKQKEALWNENGWQTSFSDYAAKKKK